MASTMDPPPRGAPGSLLGAHDPAPVRIVNPGGASRFLLIGDHAGNLIPAGLGDLGVSDADRARHIGWDIGVAALGMLLSARLDATFVRQTYSRLVIDCNRDPGAPDAMPAMSDGTPIPANAALSASDRAARVEAIHAPYQAAIAGLLADRDAAGRDTAIVSLHSCTPRMSGSATDRPWQIGVLHDAGDATFAQRCLERLRGLGGWTIGDNEPYRMDGIDHTVPRHAYPARRPYVEFEFRQDLLGGDAGVAAIADVVETVLCDDG